jgi:hypothetical protein
VEVWAVGYYSTMGDAAVFGEGYEAACLGDEAEPDQSAFAAYGAGVDDLFVIDRQGQVRYELTVAVMNLTDSGHSATLDGWVRELL